MKKIFYLLPVALLATSCGQGKFKEVDPAEVDMSGVIVDGLNNMVKSVKSGLSAELEVSIPEVSVATYSVPADPENAMSVSVKDAGFKVKLEVANGEKAEDVKAHIAVEDVHGKVVVSEGNKEIVNVSTKDIELHAYVVNNTVYADLSNAKLKECAYKVVENVVPAEGVAEIKGMVDMFAKKLYIEEVGSIVSNAILEGFAEIPAEGLTEEELAKAKEAVKAVLDEIVAEESPVKDLVSFYLTRKDAYKVSVDVTSDKIIELAGEELPEGTTMTGSASASVASDKEGRITEVKFSVDASGSTVESEGEVAMHASVVAKASAKLEISYEVPSIKAPSGYEAMDLETIAGLLGK